MITIPRAVAPPDRLRGPYEQAFVQTTAALATLRASTDLAVCDRALATARSSSLRLAQLASVFDPGGERLCFGLTVAARTRVATFVMAEARAPVTLPLDDGEPVRLPPLPSRDAVHAFAWTDAFMLTAALRDFDALNRLASVDVGLWSASSKEADEWVTLLNVALVKHLRSDPSTVQAVVDALEATAESRIRVTTFEAALYWGVPALDLLHALHERDAAHFHEALAKALECFVTIHRNPLDEGSYLALWPLGLASLAYLRGMPVEVASDVRPRRVVEGACDVARLGGRANAARAASPPFHVPATLERALLELVDEGRGDAGWRWIATRLPAKGAPLDVSMMDALEALRGRGLVGTRARADGSQAWLLTPRGRARLDELVGVEALPADALTRLADALRGGTATAIGALIPLAADGARMAAALRQVLRADPRLAERVAFGAAMLPKPDRARFALELLAEPDEQVRGALFRAWMPARTDVPGQAVRTLDEAPWDEVLRRGLRDASPAVRAAAAALVFASDRGAAHVGDLIVQLGAPERDLRGWSILALGSARDPMSRAHLESILQDRDPVFAAAAARALAARDDGRAAWLSSLDDPRPQVAEAARFALAAVAQGLAAEQEAWLARHPRPEIERALAAYRERRAASGRAGRA